MASSIGLHTRLLLYAWLSLCAWHWTHNPIKAAIRNKVATSIRAHTCAQLQEINVQVTARSLVLSARLYVEREHRGLSPLPGSSSIGSRCRRSRSSQQRCACHGMRNEQTLHG